MGSKLATARTELLKIAERLPPLGAAEVRNVVYTLMHRAVPTRALSRRVSAKVTPQLRDSIKTAVSASPDLTYFEIGRLYNVAGARVTEVMQGKYDGL